MKNENLFFNTSSLLCEDLKKQSNLQSLIERTNKELANLSEYIQKAKSFEYPDATARFANKILSKYTSSILQQIDSASLSTRKSIWVYAKDCIDLSYYEEKLKAAAISNSHVNFAFLLDDFKEKIRDDMKTFAELSLNLINSAIVFRYSFYLESISVKKFDFHDDVLTVQLELILNVC